MSNPPYVDLGDFGENERIETIGHQVMVHQQTVGFIVEDDPGKADRYITKLEKKFPGIRIISRGRGPVGHTVLVKVGPPLN